MKPTPERYVLTIQSLPDEVPAIVRLRRVLKAVLRSHRFRCIEIRPAGDQGSGPRNGDESQDSD